MKCWVNPNRERKSKPNKAPKGALLVFYCEKIIGQNFDLSEAAVKLLTADLQ